MRSSYRRASRRPAREVDGRPHPIRSNGKLLLINTVLDIAKIESGQFSLNLTSARSRTWSRRCARPPRHRESKKLGQRYQSICGVNRLSGLRLPHTKNAAFVTAGCSFPANCYVACHRYSCVHESSLGSIPSRWMLGWQEMESHGWPHVQYVGRTYNGGAHRTRHCGQ